MPAVPGRSFPFLLILLRVFSLSNRIQRRHSAALQQAVEKASKSLRRNIYPKDDDDDDEILDALKVVRTLVKGALKQDPKLKEDLASEEESCDTMSRGWE